MRVLTTTMVYPTSSHPDQGVFVQRRALALSQQPGVTLRVSSPQPWCPMLRDAVDATHPGPLPASYPRFWSVPVAGWLTDGWAFGSALEREIISDIHAGRRPDIIDGHFEYPDGVGAWIAGQRCDIPVVVTVRGKIVSLSKKALRRMQIAAMLRGVAARVAVSRSLVSWIHRVAGTELPVHVIPNGIDSAVFHPGDASHARQSLRWASDRRYVLAVGHQQRLKGFDRILRAALDIHAQAPDVRFVLVGSSRGERAFRDELTTLAERCNQLTPPGDPLVRMLAPVGPHALNQMYNAATLLVNASRSEGWCNAISEALACGTPVVAMDVGGNAEQICSPDVGLLVPNERNLSERLIQALHHPWNRAAIAEQGSARSWHDVARQVRDLLGQVLAQSQAVPASQTAEVFA